MFRLGTSLADKLDLGGADLPLDLREVEFQVDPVIRCGADGQVVAGTTDRGAIQSMDPAVLDHVKGYLLGPKGGTNQNPQEPEYAEAIETPHDPNRLGKKAPRMTLRRGKKPLYHSIKLYIRTFSVGVDAQRARCYSFSPAFCMD